MADLSGPVDPLHVPDDDCGASSEDVNSQQPQGSPGHVLGVLQGNAITIIIIYHYHHLCVSNLPCYSLYLLILLGLSSNSKKYI